MTFNKTLRSDRQWMRLGNQTSTLFYYAFVILVISGVQSFTNGGNNVINSGRKPRYHNIPLQSSAATDKVNGSNDIASSISGATTNDEDQIRLNKNRMYCATLISNLERALDNWFVTGSPEEKARAIQIIEQLYRTAMDDEDKKKAVRMASRCTFPLPKHLLDRAVSSVSYGNDTDGESRRKQVETRKQWENNFVDKNDEKSFNRKKKARSAFTGRVANPEAFMASLEGRVGGYSAGLSPENVAKDKTELENSLFLEETNQREDTENSDPKNSASYEWATEFTSQLVAKAGAGDAFKGSTIGVGGLDDVLAQIRRRVWVPLAAPPQLLNELGIKPVRGLLLYGDPGCGKTLLARKLGSILSPLRPMTIVSGPEIMDKFVGSSEANLREVFDNPPDIHDIFKKYDGETHLSRNALHVIVLDEFDAMARSRGGKGGSGEQGDAGVARDSVVNQMLAKMDGVDELCVPTLVIGLTNRRSLIEPALLRAGRFEVQIEVPPPKSVEQRIAILDIHMKSMFNASRLLVSDIPKKPHDINELLNYPTYKALLEQLAFKCENFSGASLAGVCRAAASHALERTVEKIANSIIENDMSNSIMNSCLVTMDDFDLAIQDVKESMLLNNE